MNILVADKLAAEAVDALKQLGSTVEVQPDLSADDLPNAVGNAEILIVRSTKVTQATIEAAQSLSLIIRAGAGVNTIDLACASQRGIYVSNCPGKNTAAVAELAMGLLLAADRRIVDASVSLREGRWQKKHFGASRGLCGRTLGILGMGAIGQAVARAASALGMHVIAWSRSLTAEKAAAWGVDACKSPLDVAANADAVSVHLAMSPETKHIVSTEFLERMPNGAILVNTSRGELVDTAALKLAIESKQLRVAVDVFENEPAGGDADFDQSDLAQLITCTPHIGASTDQASAAIAGEVVRIVDLYQRTGHPPGAVNLCERSPATHQLVVRHYNRVGVLASIMDGLREENVNIEEMDNIIFDNANAACCSLQLDDKPSTKLLDQIRQNENVLSVSCRGG